MTSCLVPGDRHQNVADLPWTCPHQFVEDLSNGSITAPTARVAQDFLESLSKLELFARDWMDGLGRDLGDQRCAQLVDALLLRLLALELLHQLEKA